MPPVSSSPSTTCRAQCSSSCSSNRAWRLRRRERRGNGNSSKAAIKGAPADGPTNFSGSTSDQIVGVTQSGTGAGVKSSATSDAILGTALAYGVHGIATGGGGIAVLGEALAKTGPVIAVKGSAISTFGTGVRGIEKATTGPTTGVSGYVASPAGTAGSFNNAAGGMILNGQNNGVTKFSVDGSGNVNTVGAYQIGGSNVVGIGIPTDDNLFLGVGAGTFDTGYTAYDNTFIGSEAGSINHVGSFNTFVGSGAGANNNGGSLTPSSAVMLAPATPPRAAIPSLAARPALVTSVGRRIPLSARNLVSTTSTEATTSSLALSLARTTRPATITSTSEIRAVPTEPMWRGRNTRARTYLSAHAATHDGVTFTSAIGGSHRVTRSHRTDCDLQASRASTARWSGEMAYPCTSTRTAN